MRRLNLVTLVLLTVLLSACGSGAPPAAPGGGPAAAPSGQPKEIVVAAWGDPYLANWKASLIPNFEKKHNAKVVWVPSAMSTQTLARVKAQANAQDIDVAMLDDGPQAQGVDAGLFEKVDTSKLANYANLFDNVKAKSGTAVGFGLNGAGIYYNKKVFQEKGWQPPTSWGDLLDPKFKGHVSAHTIGNANGLSLLLAMNDLFGGSGANVDPGFKKMQELAPNVITFDKTGNTYTLIQQGEAWVGEWSLGRITALQAEGVPVEFVYPKEGVYGWLEVATLVKGRPNSDLSHKFIDAILDPVEQVHTAKTVGYGPVNSKATLSPEDAKKVLYGEENIKKMKFINWDIVNPNRAAWTERWNKEVEK